MHTSTALDSSFFLDPNLASGFYAAVDELSHVVEGRGVFRVEAQAFAQGASKVRGELLGLEHLSGDERTAAEALIVELLDRITTVALSINPRERDIHRAAFEVAVRASQLAFVLRDRTTPITWQ